MGNQYWFKLSDMMPNAWFYKLRHITRPNKTPPKLPPPPQPPPAHKSPGKPCYHLPESQFFHNPISPQNPKFQDARFPHEPRRTSLKRRARRKTIYMPSPRQKPPNFDSESSFQPTDDAFSDSFLDRSTFPDSDSSGPGANVNAFIGGFPAHPRKTSEPDICHIHLSPITRRNSEPTGPKRNAGPARKSFSRIGGVKVKVKLCGNVPKTGSKRTENKRGRSRAPPEKKLAPFYAESLAIVKASIDPERDFRESMVEMIVENNIRASKDLEDLLACYLSLNSHQYHGLIIRAFEQIWFSLMSLTHC